MMSAPASDSYRGGLAAVFLCVWLALAISPIDRSVWAIENVLVLCALGLIYTYRREVPLSRASCVMILVFLCAHEIGAHYTYPQVPYERWLAQALGMDVGMGRNHYDRAVHFLFGVLITLPIREAILHTSPVRRGWSYVLPVALSMAASAGYEIFEWLGAAVFGGANGPAFVGTQGDIWDAQKDMAMATVGAILPMVWAAIREGGHASDLIGAKHMAESRLAQIR